MPASKSPTPTRESDLERKLKAWTDTHGLLNLKFVSPAYRGMPDRLILNGRGRIMFLELKAKGKKPSPLQLIQMRRLRDMNVRTEWTDNLADAITLIEECLGHSPRSRSKS
jgi:hypothetical protein